ncbi:hypothetical protein ACIOK4_13560 [Streptomyces bottropensis]|uniref:hypothetical protein n=1 Tax=Streptomyces bottropensis TaxID=42235 RepID=UPI003806FABB
MRHTTVLLAVVCLALAGCSSGGGEEPEKTVTVTATASPSLSEAEARAACVDAWRDWFDNEPAGYDPDTDPLPELPACEGLPNQAAMGAEALLERNAENRARHDECTRDPACTDFPAP